MNGADDTAQARGPMLRVLVAFAVLCVAEMSLWFTVTLVTYASGGATAAGVAAFVSFVPAIVLAPTLAALADRLPPERALSYSYAALAAAAALLWLLLFAGAPYPVIVAGSALVTVAIAIVRPRHYSDLPHRAATPGALVRANSTSMFLNGVGGFVGPFAAGMFAVHSRPWVLAAICAVGLAVASVLTRLPVDGSDRYPQHSKDQRIAVLQGLSRISSDRSVFVLLMLGAALYVVVGAQEILSVSFASTQLRLDQSGQGLLVGAASIGVLCGSLAGSGLAFRRRLSPVVVVSTVAMGAFLLLLPLTNLLSTAMLVLALSGAGNAVCTLASTTLMQRAVDDALRSRVFAVAESLLLSGYATGGLLAPLLIGGVGASGAYVVLGCGVFVAAIVVRRAATDMDSRAVFRDDVLALFRRVPFLAALRPPALAQLSNAATRVDVTIDQTIITQGESGDAYYLIEQGEYAVHENGEARRTLTRGDGFGEIALLHDVPRTASVIASSEGLLLRIERDDFLSAITQSPGSHQLALATAAERGGSGDD